MRLRKIHLAGFKSFTDPTTVDLPGDIVGIVGPNGCGKSNVIDAVRWVMGESSAKHLRGDMMADVIFNGSASRKPLGQASVELVFDNSEGRLGDRFAAYSDISVRRQVNRDGHSAYMLNGTRCRRRDITDVFLGTGLGPRSYAIIEQGTISRLIEARPEEMRDFLEEAAGISKYKERRRETENRMRHTNENLDRLNDLRDELETQIERLRRQAAQAERFKAYKAEERKVRAEVLALRWAGLDAQVRAGELALNAQNTKVDAALAEQRRIEADLERQRSAQTHATDAFNERYREVLEAGAEVGRSEEAIQNLRLQRENLSESLGRERTALENAEGNAQADAQRLESLRTRLETDSPELERQETLASAAREAHELAERDRVVFQGNWEQVNRQLEEPSRAAHSEQVRLEGLVEQSARIEQRRERLQVEQAQLRDEGPAVRLAELSERLEFVQAERRAAEERLTALQTGIASGREQESEASTRLDAARRKVHELGGRLASLEALQQAALKDGGASVIGWLERQGLSHARRVAEVIRVKEGWERALETVLGEYLQAVIVESLDPSLDAIETVGDGHLTLVQERTADARGPEIGVVPSGVSPASPGGAVELSSMLEAGHSALGTRLDGIYVVESLVEALRLRGRLGTRDSVVTRNGLWIAQGWVRVMSGGEAEDSVLAREQALREVRQASARAALVRDGLADELGELRGFLAEQEHARQDAQGNLSRVHEQDAGLRSEVSACQAEVEQRAQRARELEEELIEVTVAWDTTMYQRDETAERLEIARQQCAELEATRDRLRAQRAALEERVGQAREQWQALRQGAYERGLQLESTRSQIAALAEARTRVEQQVEGLQERCEQLKEALDGLEQPMIDGETRRQDLLAHHASLEAALRDARTGLEAGESRVRELEQERLGKEAVVQTERDGFGRVQLAAQEMAVRRETVREQIVEHGDEVSQILEQLEEGANEEAWVERLDQLDRRISRLGPINLAAIDEFEQQSERKTYLDAQHADLTEALTALQEAIRKIDQDTRARFKDTYERVNAGLEEKFPRLFGGGHAYLQLTSEDLLESGVAVMARPPGKRNSSIHLLSGGEKAMTAVALVFAIFDLNPAPFCLLDEVDAPLDEANVGRFAAIVREMSERVQMLLVTHNKTTMESVQQLVGVTMNEPGVSRLVTVDLEAAVELAAD